MVMVVMTMMVVVVVIGDAGGRWYYYLLSTHYVLDSVINTLFILTHFITPTTQQSRPHWGPRIK